MGYSASTVFSISAKKLPLEVSKLYISLLHCSETFSSPQAMLYVRILSLTKEEIEFLLDKYDQFVNAKSNYEEGLTTTRRVSLSHVQLSIYCNYKFPSIFLSVIRIVNFSSIL
jgi:hypothetical protein